MHPLRELTLDQLRLRTSMKWRGYDSDVLPLWVAEMDTSLAEPVAKAIHDATDMSDTGYPTGTAYPEALADFAGQRWGWNGLDPSRTAMVADVMTGVVEMVRLVSSPGDPVVVNPPVYPPFFGYLNHADRAIVNVPLGPEGRLDLLALESAFERASFGGRRVTYLLCNPHNPTGTVHTLAELTTVAGLAAKYGVRVVVDEIHAPLATGDVPFTPYLSVPGTEDAFSLMSASKAWNLAGLKAAVAIAGPGAAEDLQRLPEVVSHGPSHLGVIAHTAALWEGREWLDALQADLDDNRTVLDSLLREQIPQARWTPSYGTYLAWVDCRELGLGEDPAAVFLERGRVAFNPGLDFGAGGAGHIRLNYGTTPEILTEAVRRMASVV